VDQLTDFIAGEDVLRWNVPTLEVDHLGITRKPVSLSDTVALCQVLGRPAGFW
jgi:hypothetical protein